MAPTVELFHIPKFRSTRVLWLYYELEAIYRKSRSDFPQLKLHKLSPDTFRTEKPKELLAANPNGKVPAFIDCDAALAMFEGCAILHYILDHYDFDGALGDKRDKAFSAELYKLSFYTSGTLDNLFATSSPIQGGPIELEQKMQLIPQLSLEKSEKSMTPILSVPFVRLGRLPNSKAGR